MARRFVTGDKEARAALRELAKYVATPGSQAARKALRPVLAAAKDNASETDDTGSLSRSLTVKPAYRTSRLRPRFRVGPAADFVGPDGRQPVRYAHLVNYGHVNRDGSVTPGTRFMDRAFEATGEEAIKIFGAEIGPAIERRAEKLAAKK